MFIQPPPWRGWWSTEHRQAGSGWGRLGLMLRGMAMPKILSDPHGQLEGEEPRRDHTPLNYLSPTSIPLVGGTQEIYSYNTYLSLFVPKQSSFWWNTICEAISSLFYELTSVTYIHSDLFPWRKFIPNKGHLKWTHLSGATRLHRTSGGKVWQLKRHLGK